MTREEAIKIIETAKNFAYDECYEKAFDMAIKALEQEFCEDAVSRAEVIKIAKEMYLEVANMELDVKTISDCISYTASKCREVLEKKLQALSPIILQKPKTKGSYHPIISGNVQNPPKVKSAEREV